MDNVVQLVVAAAMVLAFLSSVQVVGVETVTVGNPGNDPEWSGDCVTGGYGPCNEYGAVGYAHEIGKLEIIAGQHTVFQTGKGC